MQYSTLSQHPELSFAEGLPDVRGWEVRTAADDEKVGKAHDLVIDEQNEIRFLDLDSVGLLSGKRILLPLTAAQADERDDVIWVFGMTKQQFRSLPEYAGEVEALTDEDAGRILRTLPAGAAVERAGGTDRFYERRLRAQRLGTEGGSEPRTRRSEEELAIGERAVQAGEVLIRKSVEAEGVSRPVTRGRAAVDVDKRARH